MASQSSHGSRSSWSNASGRRRTLLCSHGERLVLRVSGTKENLGRRFWGCVHYDEQEKVEEDPEKAKLRKEVIFLKIEPRHCEWRLKIAVFVALVGWIGCLACCCRN
ncbi:hypothetical protein PIB30_050090 [Stylosanthes scabra]|uniref:Zinc finger GRF-type domain-containing protein n=1 Tax=Stylosanthes scabra TaxID=79078 RepID=A0ABU6XHS8_9FABA|nr:hypothetical protein [Stylosanthes scabra]